MLKNCVICNILVDKRQLNNLSMCQSCDFKAAVSTSLQPYQQIWKQMSDYQFGKPREPIKCPEYLKISKNSQQKQSL